MAEEVENKQESVGVEKEEKKKVETVSSKWGWTVFAVVVTFLLSWGITSSSFNKLNENVDDLQTSVQSLNVKLSSLMGEPSNEQDVLNVSVDDDPFLGPKNAENIVVVFSEFQCPYCALAEGKHEQGLADFKKQDPTYEPFMPYLRKLAESGKVRVVFRDFPLDFHKDAFKAAMASECAHEQGKFWEFHDKLFENQGSLTKENFFIWADEIDGIDVDKFKQCYDNRKYESEVQKDIDEGKTYGVQGTPTAFVNGVMVVGAVPASQIESMLK